MSDEVQPLELLELRQENARLREELRYQTNRAARLDRYIKTQMKPLVSMGITQSNTIKTLERRLARLKKDK